MTKMTIHKNRVPFLIDFIRSIITASDVISGRITLLVKLHLPVCSKILQQTSRYNIRDRGDYWSHTDDCGATRYNGAVDCETAGRKAVVGCIADGERGTPKSHRLQK